VIACPFGVPKYEAEVDQMMKCDYCYDRTSIGKKPMCATVCPSQALSFTTLAEIERTRRGKAINEWRFGNEVVRTKVYVIVPQSTDRVDIGLSRLHAKPRTRSTATSGSADVAELLEESIG
jgi:Fe-S-cluster-containing dehydrogenase component